MTLAIRSIPEVEAGRIQNAAYADIVMAGALLAVDVAKAREEHRRIADRAWQIRPRALPDTLTATGEPRRIAIKGPPKGDGLLVCACGAKKSAQAVHCRACACALPRIRQPGGSHRGVDY